MDTRPPGAELTPLGREQAIAVGAQLAGLVGEHPRVLSSVAIRTQQTAMAAMREFEAQRGLAAHSVPIDPTPGLQEVFAGQLEMSGAQDTYQLYLEALRGWLRGDPEAALPGGEKLEQILARYRPVLEAAARGQRDTIVFSHGAVMRVVATHACGLDPQWAFENYMPNCGVVAMEPAGQPFGHWQLLHWADAPAGAPGTT